MASALADHLVVGESEGGFEYALHDEQPVHVTGKVIEDRPVERVHQGAGAVQAPGTDPQKRGLGAQDRHALGQGDPFDAGRTGRAAARIAGHGR